MHCEVRKIEKEGLFCFCAFADKARGAFGQIIGQIFDTQIWTRLVPFFAPFKIGRSAVIKIGEHFIKALILRLVALAPSDIIYSRFLQFVLGPETRRMDETPSAPNHTVLLAKKND